MIERWHPALAAVAAPYLERSIDFERSQKEAIADALDQVIEASGFQPGPPYQEPLFRSVYSIPRLIEHLRKMATTA